MSRPEGAPAAALEAAVPAGGAEAAAVRVSSRSSAAAEEDDASLMLRYRDEGDMRAFEMLYARHKAPLYRYLQRMCGQRAAADDLFQEVWSRVIKSRSRYEVLAQFRTFLFRIAHNCVIDHARRAVHRHERHVQDVDALEGQLPGAAQDQPDSMLSHSQLDEAFRRALDGLPAEQRDVFLLFEETGLSLEEIGRVTGVPMETAKSRLRYALAKLRAALQQHREQPSVPGV